MIKKYESIIGLEVHIELKTKTKIFCNCSTKFGCSPNSNTCPVCLGLPGSLPVLNKKVLDFSIMAGIVLNCKIYNYSKFDRKNYYYPDLTKNFQTSQFDMPICKNGYLEIEIDDKIKKIRITRIHMEEDAGKLIHSGKSITNSSYSKIDYNRAGVPLLEIVSEPDLRNSKEAKIFIENLKKIISYIEISDCKMEEGSLRCDANVSLRIKGDFNFGTRTEIKNLNSLKSLEKSIDYEIFRQKAIINSGKKIIQETRTWDEEKEVTFSMRNKENTQDYRYFPEPDLPPIILNDLWIKNIKKKLPELPNSRRNRYIKKDNLLPYDADFIISERIISDFYDNLRKKGHIPKVIVNYLMGDYIKCLKKFNLNFKNSNVTIEAFSELLDLIKEKVINGKIAKEVISEMIKTNKMPKKIVQEKSLAQISDKNLINKLLNEVLLNNKKAANDFNNGKENAISFLVGQIMKLSKGKANPSLVNDLLRNKLKNK